MKWEKVVGLVLVAVALVAFFPEWLESLYGRLVAPYVYDLSPAFYAATNAKGVVIAWCGTLAVIGGVMFLKK